jgi:hypothetical protein
MEPALGEDFSGIAVDGALLNTMYRRGFQEITVAAATSTGKTIWELAENAGFRDGTAMHPGEPALPG